MVLGSDERRRSTDMLGQIKAHPDHPDFEHWTARLTEIGLAAEGRCDRSWPP